MRVTEHRTSDPDGVRCIWPPCLALQLVRRETGKE